MVQERIIPPTVAAGCIPLEFMKHYISNSVVFFALDVHRMKARVAMEYAIYESIT